MATHQPVSRTRSPIPQLTICSQTASTSTQNQAVMTWYACGKVLPPGMLGDRFESSYLTHIRKFMPNLIPTTYEAAQAYLREENEKPKAERDLLREMVMIVTLGLPKDRKTHLVVPSMKTIFPIYDGQ